MEARTLLWFPWEDPGRGRRIGISLGPLAAAPGIWSRQQSSWAWTSCRVWVGVKLCLLWSIAFLIAVIKCLMNKLGKEGSILAHHGEEGMVIGA